MKKKILAVAVVILCLSILTGTTFAYYTKSGTARNEITSGAVEVEIVQTGDDTVTVMPTTKVSKTASARSIAQTAWVRMRYTLTVLDENGQALQIPADELEDVVLITPDETNWTEKDGWWYYQTALASGQITDPLFEQIEFAGPEMGNEYQGTRLKVELETQAVQKANNGATVLEALGWPET